MSCYWNALKNHNKKINNRSFENVAKFNNVRIYQNELYSEIKCKLLSGNASYHAVYNLLSSQLLSENLKAKIYSAVILSAVLYGCVLGLLY